MNHLLATIGWTLALWFPIAFVVRQTLPTKVSDTTARVALLVITFTAIGVGILLGLGGIR